MSAKRVYAANLLYWLSIRKCPRSRLAVAIGLTRSTVSGWTRARSSPDIEKAGEVAEYLKVPLQEFFKDPPYESGSAPPLLQVSTIDYEKYREAIEHLDEQKTITRALDHLGLELRKKRKKRSK